MRKSLIILKYKNARNSLPSNQQYKEVGAYEEADTQNLRDPISVPRISKCT